ncbi:hypothetical protein J19TS2_10800 [Cohnella xylanilytica]|uniref:Uncharacterized protein n=1 Tax=Cohnella xylanilytica TaxID=557555 RepID=A0A841TRX0_9BACL|nr:hypothetical protein [Cohnella xylanilytica]MBB6691157.1 hypothetical protein [Cohnella xylanilytica]GIO11525.1 hypothetical protein J19TS2_10800 [Cohnella xylanilytica]
MLEKKNFLLSKEKVTKSIVAFSVFSIICINQSASAYVTPSRSIFIDSTCPVGSASYVLGVDRGSENGFFPEAELGRVYFNWYTNGVFSGSKQSEDSTQPINVEAKTASCTHKSSNDYEMRWSEHWEYEDGNDYDFAGTEYWEGD